MLVRQSNAQTVSKSKTSSAVPVAQLDASKIHTWMLPPLHINEKSVLMDKESLRMSFRGLLVDVERRQHPRMDFRGIQLGDWDSR
jgi:hypothetical protein